ncbi:Exocyst complex component 6, partial [Dissostichus eleginoides]
VAQTACMSACKHISTSLMQLLLDPDVRQISMGALQQLNADVKECEGFARAGPVAGFQGDTLLLAFSDLRQVTVAGMRETSRKNNVFAQFRKTDRDRQKLIDTIIKQLRNLIAQQQA